MGLPPEPNDGRLPPTPRRWWLARTAAARLFDASGALRVWDRFANSSTPRIVYYHNVHGPEDDVSWCREPSLTISRALFRRHVDSLRKNFAIVGLDEVLAAPSQRRVALTFDDGYRGVYDHAFPLLREWGIPATVFLVTDRIGSADLLWWDRFLSGVEHLRRLGAPDQKARLSDVSPQWRQLLENERLERLLNAYKAASRVERDAVGGVLAGLASASGQAPSRIFLSAEEVRELANAGFTFGAHTKSHPMLTWLDHESLMDELVGSRDVVLSLTGQTRCWFSYPNGTFGDREEQAVIEAGFTGAVQTGLRPQRSGRFALPRVGISPGGITSADGRYSPWRSRWLLSRFTRGRILNLLPGPRLFG